MLSLVYVSSATREFSDADLVELLRRSRKKNSGMEITGMLLYKDGNFMQVLEGPEDSVRKLIADISTDDRHRGVIRLTECHVEERAFPDWSMAFRNLNDPSLRTLEGYSEFMNEPLDPEALQRDPNRARKLLSIFKRNMQL